MKHFLFLFTVVIFFARHSQNPGVIDPNNKEISHCSGGTPFDSSKYGMLIDFPLQVKQSVRQKFVRDTIGKRFTVFEYDPIPGRGLYTHVKKIGSSFYKQIFFNGYIVYEEISHNGKVEDKFRYERAIKFFKVKL